MMNITQVEFRKNKTIYVYEMNYRKKKKKMSLSLSQEKENIQFECQVCVSTLKRNTRNKSLTCRMCDYTVCNHCQKQYCQSTCMNCQREWPPKVLSEKLGLVFVRKELTHKKTAQMIQNEKKLIPATQVLVDWLHTKKQNEERFFQGEIADAIGPMPIIRPNNNNSSMEEQEEMETCRTQKCNGYLLPDKKSCRVCKHPHCSKCLELITNQQQQQQHTCDPLILQNRQEIMQSCKRCPSCRTYIYKITGCDDMHCTQCNIHFSFERGERISNSSNHHYHNLARRVGSCGAPIRTDADHIPMDIMEEKLGKLSSSVSTLLYEHPNIVREMRRTQYAIQSLHLGFCKKKDSLRVRFITNKINETQWGSSLLTATVAYERDMIITDILRLYLEFMGEMQSHLFNQDTNEETCVATIIEFLKSCNASLEGAYENLFYSSIHMNEQLHFEIPEPNQPISSIPLAKNANTTTTTTTTAPILLHSKAKEAKAKAKATEAKTKASEVLPITLLDYQMPHMDKLLNILSQYNIALDLSPLGSGKTYTACKYIQLRTFERVIIICPASLREKWKRVTNEYNITGVTIMSYNELAGNKHTQPKHELLERNDYTQQQTVRDVHIVRFEPSQKLIQLMDSSWRGACFIFDEFQYLKSETSATTRAARTILKSIRSNTNENKALLLSGSPFDNTTQILTFFRNIDVFQASWLIHYNSNTLSGIQEIIAFCDSLDQEQQPGFQQIIQQALYSQRRKSMTRCLESIVPLFTHHIQHYLTSSMAVTELNRVTNINTFYTIRGQAATIYDTAIGKIRRIASDSSSSSSSRSSTVALEIVKALQLLESSKIDVFVSRALIALQANPNNKVVIALHYQHTVDEVFTSLEEMGCQPYKLTGKVNTKKREEIINSFQEPSTKIRLLVCNMRVISTGLDLDDKHGSFPRHVFVSPTFNAMEMYQHAQRYHRSISTMSNTIIRYVYASNHLSEEEKTLLKNKESSSLVQSQLLNKNTKKKAQEQAQAQEQEQEQTQEQARVQSPVQSPVQSQARKQVQAPEQSPEQETTTRIFEENGCEAHLLQIIGQKSSLMQTICNHANMTFLYEVV